MRNLVLVILISFLVSICSEAQSNFDFGIKGGVNLTFFKVVDGNFGASPETEFGYYGGIFLDIEINEGFSIQPEVLYIRLNDFKFLNAPIYTKYELANNLNILVGPSINYFFDFLSNKLKIRADLSVGYNITPFLDAHLKYTLGFQEITPNGLFLGLGYEL